MVGKGIVWFAKKECKFSQKAEGLLSKIGASNKRIDVDSWPADDIKKMQIESAHMTFPNIYISKMHVGGFEKLDELYKNKKLFHMLKEEGISYKEDTERN